MVALARQRARQHLEGIHAPGLSTEEREAQRHRRDRRHRQRCEGRPPALAQQVQPEDRGIDLEHGRHPDHGAGRHGAATDDEQPCRERQQEQDQEVLLAEQEVRPQGNDGQERDQRDSAQPELRELPEHEHRAREEPEIQHQPDTLRAERRQPHQRCHEQRRERAQRAVADDVAGEDARVILLALKPNPVVDALEGIAVTKQPPRHVVVWKIGVEAPPGGNEGLPEEERDQQGQGCPFETCHLRVSQPHASPCPGPHAAHLTRRSSERVGSAPWTSDG